MRVIFLEVDTERDWAVASLGPAFIGPVLRAAGHEVELLRAPVDETPEDVGRSVLERNPDLIGLSLTTRQWLRALELCRAIKNHCRAPILAGGLHPTYSPEATLESGAIDIVCLGEGELASLELCNALDRGADWRALKIANLMTRGQARPGLRPAFEPLDALPFVARDLLDERHGVVHLTTQRGCPFPCSYCAARSYEDLYQGVSEYGRRRTVDNVIKELSELRDNSQLSYLIVLDDTFTIHHPWVSEFCARYSQEIRVPFSLHARVETVNERLLQELASAGCRHITYGVESGSERLRRDVMLRPVENARFKKVFKASREAGILVTANYMLGLPFETPEDLEATLQLAEDLDCDDFGYFVFYPYPGTALYQTCLREGYLPEDLLALPATHRESILKMPQLSPEAIRAAYDRMTEIRIRKVCARNEANTREGWSQKIREDFQKSAACG